VIRPASPSDAPAIVALENLLFGGDAWSSATVAQTLGSRTVLVADDDGLAGYVVVALAGDIADLERIGVRPQRQRSGLATALLAAARDAVPAERMLLEVRADNEAALGFYARAGFVEIDRRRRYYRDGADAIVLGLEVER
jgi:ribosomal-protein-alanine acetyltransferase